MGSAMASPIQKKQSVEGLKEQLRKLGESKAGKPSRIPPFAVEMLIDSYRNDKTISKIEQDSKGVLITFKNTPARDAVVSAINTDPIVTNLELPLITSPKYSFGLRIENSDVEDFNTSLKKKEGERVEMELGSFFDIIGWGKESTQYFRIKGVSAYSIRGQPALQMRDDDVAKEFSELGIHLVKMGEYHYFLSGQPEDVPEHMRDSRGETPATVKIPTSAGKIPTTVGKTPTAAGKTSAVAPQTAASKAADLKELDGIIQDLSRLASKYDIRGGSGEIESNIEQASRMALDSAERIKKATQDQISRTQRKMEKAREESRQEMQEKYAAEVKDLKDKQLELKALVTKLEKKVEEINAGKKDKK